MFGIVAFGLWKYGVGMEDFEADDDVALVTLDLATELDLTTELDCTAELD